MSTLSRTVVTGPIALMRLPVDAALRAGGSRTTGARAALDRLEARVVETVDVLLADRDLAEHARLKRAAAAERERAASLREHAEESVERSGERRAARKQTARSTARKRAAAGKRRAEGARADALEQKDEALDARDDALTAIEEAERLKTAAEKAKTARKTARKARS